MVKFITPFLHWYIRPVPIAVIEKLAEPPTVAVWLVGCEVILGVALTAKETLFEVTFGNRVPEIITL